MHPCERAVAWCAGLRRFGAVVYVVCFICLSSVLHEAPIPMGKRGQCCSSLLSAQKGLRHFLHVWVVAAVEWGGAWLNGGLLQHGQIQRLIVHHVERGDHINYERKLNAGARKLA